MTLDNVSNTGCITQEELNAGLPMLGSVVHNLDQVNKDQMFKALDDDCDGVISHHEFISGSAYFLLSD